MRIDEALSDVELLGIEIAPFIYFTKRVNELRVLVLEDRELDPPPEEKIS